jgi:hypothetical protein
MADTYDMNTLLPVETIQAIAQLYGSPAFSDKSGYNGLSGRQWHFHYFTGRVPTPAEFYYGIFVDKIGDSHQTLPLDIPTKHLGYTRVRCDASSDAGGSTVDLNMKANGAMAPSGITFVTYQTGDTPVARDPNSDATWMLDWAFSASHPITLSGGNKPNLRAMGAAGELVLGAKPTWFYISESANIFDSELQNIDHPTINNLWQASINRDKNTYADRHPIIMGTVGELGSGADLELSQGGDSIADQIKPVSLRIQCNPTA